MRIKEICDIPKLAQCILMTIHPIQYPIIKVNPNYMHVICLQIECHSQGWNILDCVQLVPGCVPLLDSPNRSGHQLTFMDSTNCDTRVSVAT